MVGITDYGGGEIAKHSYTSMYIIHRVCVCVCVCMCVCVRIKIMALFYNVIIILSMHVLR